jgi:Mor family transcriptional regulator
MVKTAKPTTEITNTLPLDLAEGLTLSDDIVEDILRRVIAMAPGFSAALAKQIEEGVRADWGGQQAYIGKRQGDQRNERNAAIRRDFYMHGMHIGALCRVYKLTRVQIWRIVNQPLESTSPPAA